VQRDCETQQPKGLRLQANSGNWEPPASYKPAFVTLTRLTTATERMRKFSVWILQTAANGWFLEWTQLEENIPDIFTDNQHLASNLIAQHKNYFPLNFL
jgi:hypothetical protein